MQEAIKLASDRLGQIVEDAASEVYLFSADDFTFTLVNRGARENLGYSMSDLRDMVAWDIKPELSRDAFLSLVQPLLRAKKPPLSMRPYTNAKMARVITS